MFLFYFSILFISFNFYDTSNVDSNLNDIFIKFSQISNSRELAEHLKGYNYSTQKCLNNEQNTSHFNSTLNSVIKQFVDSVLIPKCFSNNLMENGSSKESFINSYKPWVYGILSVTFINGCAALGVLFIPFMRHKFYKTIMNFMIALAVGSLAGSALLILIPDAYSLSELEHKAGVKVGYKYRANVVFGGIYMFFILERFLKWILNRNHRSKSVQSENLKRSFQGGSMNLERKCTRQLSGSSLIIAEADSTLDNTNGQMLQPIDDESIIVIKKAAVKIAPVAWMIIAGDALHNFVDGLSIGAAFSKDILTGISLSIAVLCEELPHELGDFAILLTAGMSIKRALCWNLISSFSCYLGFGLGATLGELTSASIWIFAIAGGMFLYISLVDMMPEINAVLEDRTDAERAEIPTIVVFVLQNIGLLLGYFVIFVMAMYGDRITLNSS